MGVIVWRMVENGKGVVLGTSLRSFAQPTD